VQEGKSAGDVGQIIGISGRTVEWHLANIFEALGVRTRVQAVVRARELGLLPTGERAGHLPAADRSFGRQARSR
jgi:ATP/maltotriose-dependent transcriptional regulator MalT